MRVFLTIVALLMANVCFASERVIVYFHAEWCGPCKELSKVFSDPAIDKEIKDGKMVLLGLDYDEHTAEAARYGVTALPTVVIVDTDWKVSTEINRFTGGVNRTGLINFLRKARK